WSLSMVSRTRPAPPSKEKKSSSSSITHSIGPAPKCLRCWKSTARATQEKLWRLRLPIQASRPAASRLRKSSLPSILATLCFAIALAPGCRTAANPNPDSADPKEARALSPELREMAQKLLGPRVRVVLEGDLAHNGRRQLLLIDPADDS